MDAAVHAPQHDVLQAQEPRGRPARRGPATEARQLYLETPESEAARAAAREFSRLAGPVDAGRPDKHERRDLLRVLKGRG